jgi:hypothetical protein
MTHRVCGASNLERNCAGKQPSEIVPSDRQQVCIGSFATDTLDARFARCPEWPVSRRIRIFDSAA